MGSPPVGQDRPARPALAGVAPVIPTPSRPVDDDEEVDCAAAPRLIEFAVDLGAEDVCLPALAGEYDTLTEEERRRLIDGAVRAALGGSTPP